MVLGFISNESPGTVRSFLLTGAEKNYRNFRIAHQVKWPAGKKPAIFLQTVPFHASESIGEMTTLSVNDHRYSNLWFLRLFSPTF